MKYSRRGLQLIKTINAAARRQSLISSHQVESEDDRDTNMRDSFVKVPVLVGEELDETTGEYFPVYGLVSAF